MIAVAILGPYLIPYDPLASLAEKALKPPSHEQWFGTDQLGRDVFSRVVVATRLDLLISVSAVALSSSTTPSRTRPGTATRGSGKGASGGPATRRSVSEPSEPDVGTSAVPAAVWVVTMRWHSRPEAPRCWSMTWEVHATVRVAR